MKKPIVLLSFVLTVLNAKTQTQIADFETFTLTPNSAYSPTNSLPFQTSGAVFDYSYNSTWGIWDGGFSYTNVKDSITSGLSNEYGVRAYNGFTNSTNYVVGLDESMIRLAMPQSTVNGFYVTNTTYAYKSMAQGDLFARKFGDTTGTGTGTTIAQGSYPDFFKLVVKGYLNGILKNDSVTFLLADFTFTNNAQDYILDTWQFVNTSGIGTVDSLQFFMRSSDVGDFGINTPLYFAIDNFETVSPNTVGLNENESFKNFKLYPNPCQSSFMINNDKAFKVNISNSEGDTIYNQDELNNRIEINLEAVPSGIYFVEISVGFKRLTKKVIKN